MPMIISSPASGMLNWLSVAAITTSEARGTPAMPFEVIIRIASIGELRAERHVDVVGLGDEELAKVQYIIEPSRLNE